LELTDKSRMDGCHATGGAFTNLGTLEQAQPFFESSDGRIAIASVDITLMVALKGGLGLFGGVIDEAGCHIERFAGLLMGRAVKTAAYQCHLGLPVARI